MTTLDPPTDEAPGAALLRRRGRWRSGDFLFRAAVVGAGWVIIAVLVATAVFLLAQSLPALRHYGPFGFLTSQRWAPSEADATLTRPDPFGVLEFAYGSVRTAL